MNMLLLMVIIGRDLVYNFLRMLYDVSGFVFT